MKEITIVGAGLAGSECAWQLASRGIPVRLVEMRPQRMTPAHHTGDFADTSQRRLLPCGGGRRSGRRPHGLFTDDHGEP